MTHTYMGELGRLVPLPGVSSVSSSAPPRYTSRTTLEGRVKLQRRLYSRRSWRAHMNMPTYAQQAPLLSFASGEWGVGPWHWVTPHAQTGNLLTPEESSLQHMLAGTLTLAGPQRDSRGEWRGQSLWSAYSGAAGVAVVERIPVVPGVPVTWAVDVARAPGGVAPRVVIWLFNASHAITATAYGDGAATNAIQRVSATIVPNQGHHYATVGLMNSVQSACAPSVTWTEQPVDFIPGQGCRAAVVDPASIDQAVIVGRELWAPLDFSITEVG